MPEAITVFFLLAATAGIFLIAQFKARNPASRDAAAELRQLRHQHAWLAEQLERARREQWDHVMITHLTGQLAAATRELEKAAPADLQKVQDPA